MQFLNAGAASIFLAPGTVVSPADDPLVLFDFVTTAAELLGPFDVAQYNSLEIQVTQVLGPDDITLVWREAAGGAVIDQASFTTPVGTGLYRTPCKGSVLEVTMGAHNAAVVIIASYRQVPSVQYSSLPSTAPAQGTVLGKPGDGMSAWAGGNLAPAGQAVAQVFSRNGPGHLYFNAGPGSSTWDAYLVDVSTGSTLAGIEGIAGTTAAEIDLIIPARPVQLRVLNVGSTVTTQFFANLVYTVA